MLNECQTIRTMDFSYLPWTFRTVRITDRSYHGLFVRTILGLFVPL